MTDKFSVVIKFHFGYLIAQDQEEYRGETYYKLDQLGQDVYVKKENIKHHLIYKLSQYKKDLSSTEKYLNPLYEIFETNLFGDDGIFAESGLVFDEDVHISRFDKGVVTINATLATDPTTDPEFRHYYRDAQDVANSIHGDLREFLRTCEDYGSTERKNYYDIFSSVLHTDIRQRANKMKVYRAFPDKKNKGKLMIKYQGRQDVVYVYRPKLSVWDIDVDVF